MPGIEGSVAQERPWQAGPLASILRCVTEPGLDSPLSRTAASEAVQDIGWRYLLGTLSVSVPVRSLTHASDVAAAALAASGQDADDHLRIDLRPDRVELSVQTRALSAVTGRDTQLARRITNAVGELGLCPAGATSGESPRPVQMLEMARLGRTTCR